jgi:beta-lactamase class A
MIESLKKALIERAESLDGEMGIAFLSLRDKEEFLYKEHEVFHAASIIKLAIGAELFRQVDRGMLDLDEGALLTEGNKIGGAGVLKELHNGLVLTVRDLAILMIVLSDNVASNMLIDLVGMEKVNVLMREVGMKESRLRKKFMVELSDPSIINEMTPFDTMLLLQSIQDGPLLSVSSRKEVIDILCRQQYNEKIPLFLPEDLFVAHKTGEVTGVRHDAALVFLPHSPYILVTFTKALKDPLEGDRAIADISLLVYTHMMKKIADSGQPPSFVGQAREALHVQ